MAKEDLRVIKTLDSVDQSLLENLKKTPFNKITVEALCEKARINRTTFYKHYRDKYELLDNYLARVLEEFRIKNDVVFVDADPETINEDKYKMPFRDTVEFIISSQPGKIRAAGAEKNRAPLTREPCFCACHKPGNITICIFIFLR